MGERQLSAYQERELLTLLEDQIKSGATKKVLNFTKYTKPDYRINWHHIVLCDYLDKLAKGEITRLMVFMPSRVGKSELVSRRFPAYMMGLNPDLQIITASYSDTLARKMNMDVQRIIKEPSYKALFPDTRIGEIGKDQIQAQRRTDYFEIVDRQGKYLSAGIGTGITGMGADLAIIDDPVKDQAEADSETMREKAWDWYDSVLKTRLEKDSRVLLTMTRWHEGDLAGKIMQQMKDDPESDQFTILKFPMECIDESNPLDPRKAGEPLWPWKFPKRKVETIKASSQEKTWASLYQQEPTVLQGEYFLERMIKFDDIPMEFDYTFAMADTAFKDKQKSDFHCMGYFGVKGDQLYIIDVFHKQIKASEAEQKFREFIKPKIKYGFRGLYIEPKGHGIYLNQTFSQESMMIPSEDKVQEFFKDRTKDKVERANNAIPHLARRTIIMNNQIEDRKNLKNQLLGFPNAAHDDFVDVVVDAIKFTYGKPPSVFDLLD